MSLSLSSVFREHLTCGKGPDFDMEALLELEASLVETDSFLDDGEMICMAEEEMRDKDGENMDAA